MSKNPPTFRGKIASLDTSCTSRKKYIMGSRKQRIQQSTERCKGNSQDDGEGHFQAQLGFGLRSHQPAQEEEAGLQAGCLRGKWN